MCSRWAHSIDKVVRPPAKEYQFEGSTVEEIVTKIKTKIEETVCTYIENEITTDKKDKIEDDNIFFVYRQDKVYKPDNITGEWYNKAEDLATEYDKLVTGEEESEATSATGIQYSIECAERLWPLNVTFDAQWIRANLTNEPTYKPKAEGEESEYTTGDKEMLVRVGSKDIPHDKQTFGELAGELWTHMKEQVKECIIKQLALIKDSPSSLEFTISIRYNLKQLREKNSVQTFGNGYDQHMFYLKLLDQLHIVTKGEYKPNTKEEEIAVKTVLDSGLGEQALDIEYSQEDILVTVQLQERMRFLRSFLHRRVVVNQWFYGRLLKDREELRICKEQLEKVKGELEIEQDLKRGVLKELNQTKNMVKQLEEQIRTMKQGKSPEKPNNRRRRRRKPEKNREMGDMRMQSSHWMFIQ